MSKLDDAGIKQEFTSRSAPPGPVSKPELEKLTNEREHVTPPTLKPEQPGPGLGGSTTQDTSSAQITNDQQVKEREERIQQIQERLGRQQGRSQAEFQKANVVPNPDPVSRQETVAQKQEIERREARVKYIQQRLDSKRDRARNAFDRSR